MRDYETEKRDRVEFIRGLVAEAKADGIVYANSGGKDCTLVGILCKEACGNTIGVIMPCGTKQNYGSDRTDAMTAAAKFGIETREADLTEVRERLIGEMGNGLSLNAVSNIAPRLRMTALYAISVNENRLVAGTGNRSEYHMGYFTKWGDGAYDLNPIADLTVTEIYEFLRYLGAPESIIAKAPSAGLYDGQTDEGAMGISYSSIDKYLLTGEASETDLEIIRRFHDASEHKRKMPKVYPVSPSH